jgi:hypothetical protein
MKRVSLDHQYGARLDFQIVHGQCDGVCWVENSHLPTFSDNIDQANAADKAAWI